MGLRFPKTVWIVPTTRCNTRCRTCEHYYKESGEDMSPEVFARIESEVLDHVRRVHLVGAGEPLISKIFPQMLEACFRRKIKVFFITNTIALTEELIRLLVRNDAEIMVSIDGATAGTYNAIRPFIKFDRLLAKLQLIKDIRAQHPGNQFKLYTNTVVMQRNLPELAQMVELAHTYAVDSAIFSDYIPHEVHPDFNAEMPFMFPELIRANAPQAIALARKYQLNYEMPAYYQLLCTDAAQAAPAPQADQEAPPRPDAARQKHAFAPKEFIFPQKCRMLWTHSNLLVNGDVSSCCTTDRFLGNLLKDSFADIWNGPLYQEARQLIQTNNPPSDCKRCNLGAGIAAGDPGFFTQFLANNHLQSLALDDARLNFSPRPKSTGQGLLIETPTELVLNTGDAEFLALKVLPADGVHGQATLDNTVHPFNFEAETVLIPLAQDGRNDSRRLRLEFSAPAQLTGLDLLSYTHKTVKVASIQKQTRLDKFQHNLALARTRLAAALAANPRLRTAIVFGASPFGAALGQLGQELGLQILGFIDNFVDDFDDAPLFEPTELRKLRPDVVLIASVAHAQAIAEQVQTLVDHEPVIISGRE